MRFTKMHGLGNDYIYVNCFQEQVPNAPALARAVSERHFGIGSDGLILIYPSDRGHVRMEIYNADGSRAQMCGNGIRCVAKYAVDHGLSRARPLRIETDAGVMTIDYTVDDHGRLATATVDMGEPRLEPHLLPVKLPRDRMVARPIEVRGRKLSMTCVSIGNPHAVFFVDDLDGIDLPLDGSFIENHELFPERVNVHFVRVDAPDEATMRTWERGSGATLACGTGAAAVAVAGVLEARLDRCLTVHLPGGPLDLEWRLHDNHVYMTGPATEVFSGEWPDG